MNQLLDQLDSNSLPLLIAMIQIASIAFIAWLVGQMLHRRLQQQHFVWVAALVAIALVVPLQSFVPTWQLAVLPDASPDRVDLASLSQASPTIPNADSSLPPIQRRSESALNETLLVSEQTSGDWPIVEASPKTITPEFEIEQRLRSAPAPESLESAVFTPTEFSRFLKAAEPWLKTIAIAYAFVTLVLLTRFIIACLRLHLINSQRLTSKRTLELIAVAEREIGVVNRSKICLCRVVSTPMAYGIIQPTILLPIDFESWPLETQRTVMLHELCHVQRRDAIWDFLAGLLCVAYWFHPAVHFVRTCLRRSRETATDQMVLKLGVAPTRYAKDLLQVAIGKRQPKLAIPMAAGSDLKERIERVLATDPAKISRPGWLWPVRLAVFVGFLFISAFSFRLTAEAATKSTPSLTSSTISKQLSEESEQDEDKSEKANDKKKAKQPDTIPESSSFYELLDSISVQSGPKPLVKDTKRVTVSGRLLDEGRQPVANAIVVLRDGRSLSTIGGKINDIFAKTNTDAEGGFQFVDLEIERSLRNLDLLAVVDSGSIAWKSIHFRDQNIHNNVRLDLQPVTPLRGRLVSTTKQPVQNAKLRVVYIRKQTGRGPSTSNSSVSFTDRMIAPSTISDENGAFEFPSMPIGFAVSIIVDHPDYAIEHLNVRTSDEHPAEFAPIGDRDPIKILDNDVEHVIEKGILAGGRLVNTESEPIADAMISILGRAVKTDAEGRFETYCKAEFLNGRDEAWVLVGSPAHISLKVSTEELASKSALIRVGNFATLSGVVLSSSNNKPIPMANLSIGSAGTIGTFTTGVDGRFEFKVRPSQTVVLKVLPTKGFIPTPSDGSKQNAFERILNDVKEGEIRELSPILLDPIERRLARVVDSEGQPVANATVELLNRNGEFNFTSLALFGTGKTEMDGRVMIETDEAIGENSILIAKWESDGKTLIGEAMMQEDEVETKIVVTKAAVLRGKTTVNGQPLGGIELAISSVLPPVPHKVPNKRGVILAMRSISHAIGRTTSDKNGNYSILVPQTNYLEQLPSYSVSVRGGVPNPNASGIGKRAKFENNEFRHDIEFKRGEGSISGQVLDANGQPVQYVSVKIQRGPGVPGQESCDPARLYLPSDDITDVNGRFQLSGLPQDLVYRVNTYPGRQIRNADREEYKSLNIVSPNDNPLEIRIPLKRD